MNPSNGKPTPIMINIDFGSKKASSSKKRKCEKKKDVFKLPRGQMTLTQMPCMSPPLGRNLDEGSEEEPVNLLPDSLANEKKDFPLDDDLKESDSLVVVPFISKDEEETVVFTVGDLVEMKHHVLNQYVQLGLIKGSIDDEHVEVYWLWHAADGNEDLVFVKKVETVPAQTLTRLAKFDEPLDGKMFNWWKYKGIMRHFVFYADGRGWKFRENHW